MHQQAHPDVDVGCRWHAQAADGCSLRIIGGADPRGLVPGHQEVPAPGVSIYHTPMPYAMFFSGGQAVHYSADFAARGYRGASYGCVNVRDRSGIQSLYEQAQIGDKVIVYR